MATRNTIWILSSKTPKNIGFAMENPNTETAYRSVGSFRIWILTGKSTKNMQAMENQNKETAYRSVGSFRIWILIGKTPKNTFCKGKQEYGNSL